MRRKSASNSAPEQHVQACPLNHQATFLMFPQCLLMYLKHIRSTGLFKDDKLPIYEGRTDLSTISFKTMNRDRIRCLLKALLKIAKRKLYKKVESKASHFNHADKALCKTQHIDSLADIYLISWMEQHW